MTTHNFRTLDGTAFNETRDAVHAYARVLGNWLKQCCDKRKHWWHASLRPSLKGLTTGVIHAPVGFELELNLRESVLLATTVTGEQLRLALQGQSASQLIEAIRGFLADAGLDERFLIDATLSEEFTLAHTHYSPEQAAALAQALSAVSAAMASFRAGIREETSPIQLWPHHFDLSMLWLPGEKIPGQDPENEEYADKQMNFGFTFGDNSIPEPYFYITAYPLPDALPTTVLPSGTIWKSEGFSGAVLRYKTLVEVNDPAAYLLDLWNGLLAAGRAQMLENNTGDVHHD